ncbi:MAG: dockerin type I domain-containing protein [Candidatus Zixiibacteriota bacterium]
MPIRRCLILSCIIAMFSLLFSAAPAFSEEEEHILKPVTRWPKESPIRPVSFTEWKTTHTSIGPFEIELLMRANSQTAEKTPGYICIIINRDLYYQVVSSISQYMDDLTSDSYTVELILTLGGQPADLRQFLADKYASGMTGAILIGDLPIAWYEKTCDWIDWAEYEDWPCDLYFMDLDGVWGDLDGDGMFDKHEGDSYPEIWIGRLLPSPLTYGSGTEASLLENYFNKNHKYRLGQMPLANKSLFFTDDDWAPADYLNDYLGTIYSDQEYIWDPYETTADNYRATIPEHFEFIHVNAHSDVHSHYFYIPGENGRTVGYGDIVGIDPPAAFYNLYACSNTRYSDPNYMGGWYVFKSQFGLAAIGSTKTGGMLDDQYFYYPLSDDSTIGEAYKVWFTNAIDDNWIDPCCWFYGMTLCGDPTLHVKQSSYIRILGANFSDAAYGDGDFLYEPGETVTCEFALKNTGSIPAHDVTLSLSCNDNQLTFGNSTMAIGAVDTNQTIMTPATITFSIPANCTPRSDSFYLELNYNGGAIDTITYVMTIGRAEILLVDDDDGDTLEVFYTSYFDRTGIPYDYHETSGAIPIGDTLNGYSAVIWFTGDYRINPLDNNEISAMKTYMDAGGNLLLTGQAIAAQLHLYTDVDFLNNYLKSSYLSTSYIPLVVCQPGATVFGDIGDSAAIGGNLGAHNQTQPDHIAAINGGVSEMKYLMSTDDAAVSYDGSYKSVFFSYGLEGISSIDSRFLVRDTVIARVLDFFGYAPLNAPTLSGVDITPGDPMKLTDHHPAISWTYFDIDGLPQTEYQVRISGTGLIGGIIVYDSGPVSGSETTLPYSGDDLLDGETYEVAIRASNGVLWSAWHTTQMHFNSIPSPQLMSPSGGEMIQDLSPILQHDNAQDEEGDSVLAFSYELYGDAELTQLIESLYDISPGSDTLCFWSLSATLEQGGWYYWRIRGEDELEVGSWGEPAVFRIQPDYICGDANGDETVNIGDAVFLIAYIFKGGPAPDPIEAADANCDATVNVGDAVYLINFIFKGGDAPCAGCP